MNLRDYVQFDLSNFPINQVVRVERKQDTIVIVSVVEGHSFFYSDSEHIVDAFVNRWKDEVFYPAIERDAAKITLEAC